MLRCAADRSPRRIYADPDLLGDERDTSDARPPYEQAAEPLIQWL